MKHYEVLIGGTVPRKSGGFYSRGLVINDTEVDDAKALVAIGVLRLHVPREEPKRLVTREELARVEAALNEHNWAGETLDQTLMRIVSGTVAAPALTIGAEILNEIEAIIAPVQGDMKTTDTVRVLVELFEIVVKHAPDGDVVSFARKIFGEMPPPPLEAIDPTTRARKR